MNKITDKNITSCGKNRLTRFQQAFSLLEIMIAMAIMAIMVAVAFPNLGNSSDKQAKKEILRLVAAIELVRDRSVITNQEFGLNIDEKGYQFLRLNENEDEEDKQKVANKKNGDEKNQNDGKRKQKMSIAKWEIIEDIPGLSFYEFPEGIEVNVSIDGENVFSISEGEIEIFEEDLEIFSDDEKEKKVDPPQVYFLSSGEQNQFAIAAAVDSRLQSNKRERIFYRVRGLLTGELKYEGPLDGDIVRDINREYERD